MKRVLLSVVGLISLGMVCAQESTSISVWEGDSLAGTYNLYNVDSLTFHKNVGTMKVWEKNAKAVEYSQSEVDSITLFSPKIENTNKLSYEELDAIFDPIEIPTDGYKSRVKSNFNPLMSHAFGADPFAMVYDGRIYVYMSDDHKTYNSDGSLKEGDYSDIKNIRIISSDDMANWTDHGAQPIAGRSRYEEDEHYGWKNNNANWANNSWAPAAAYKIINGKAKFFLYFADNGSGIGVMTSSTPYGPWTDPIKRQLISRSTPNCGDVTWLFDPAVFVDDDGKAYLYFGGGVPDGKDANPGTARAVQLGDDMISIVGTPVKLNPPYLFEDSGINKIGGKYLYSYCSNWAQNSNPGVAKIAYMKSDNPLGPFTYVGAFFDNPGGASWAGGGGNNHHAVCEFNGKYYIFYHTRALKGAMGITGGAELRSACVSELSVDTVNAKFNYLSASQITAKGVKQLKNLDPFKKTEGETMAWTNSIQTELTINKWTKKCTVTAYATEPGAWIGLSNVDFKNGPEYFTAKVSGKGILKVCSSYPGTGPVLCYVELPGEGKTKEVTVPLQKSVTGVKKLFFVFSEANGSIDYWQFY